MQGLVVLPDVLKRLDQDVAWTSDLGNAFLAQQQDVMDAVQRLRQKASAAGALQSTKEQTVTTATGNNQTYIEIQPASTQVVYVPQYNPEAVWGPPPEYPIPSHLLSPGFHRRRGRRERNFLRSGNGVGAIWSGGGGWGGYGWGCGWGRGNNVVINNNFISSNHFNRVNVGNNNNWVHNPVHRGGVPYNNRNVANRYQGAGAGRNVATRPTVGQTQQRLNQANPGQRGPGGMGQPGQANIGQRGGGMAGQGGAARAGQGNPGRGGAGAIGQHGGGMPAQGSASRITQGNIGQGGGERIGNRNLGGGGFGSQGAFGGMGQGGDRARMNSSRGFASRGGGGGGGFRGGGGGSRGGGRRR